MLTDISTTKHRVYGNEVNPITDFDDALVPAADAPTVDWTEVAEVTRLRLVTDRGCPFWDVSYCWGLTHDDVPCRVQLPFHQLPKGKDKVTGRSLLMDRLIRHARRDGVFLKDLGLFDAISKCW